ncbi:hypothetical protein NPX13_g10536 [Xylaria arbuscula]|uniref:Integrase catalytic domain-containing protein n=1 Tax=Xylaria arbuscula TaxID=114810 RepID=A0A9W8TGH7_9PEZI|nr:hypothetical protein NPX13_g10536 [Xylaria arbuscula]
MQKPINQDAKIALRNANDFYSWNRELKSKAVGLDLWDYITPDLEMKIPWPKRPIMPKIEDYPKAATTPALATRSSSTVDHETIDPRPPRSVTEMTAVGRNAYNTDSNNYNARIREYTDLIKSINQLKNWILETVSQNYKDTLLEPTDTLDVWYEKLCTIGAHLKGSLMHQARLDYRSFIDNSAKRSPKDLGTWATEWEGKLAIAVKHGASDLIESYNIATDLEKALGTSYQEWVTAFRQTNKLEIKQGTLDYTEVAADLRDEASIRLSVRSKPTKKEPHKGSFHTYGDIEEIGDSIEVEDPDSRPRAAGRGKARGFRGRGLQERTPGSTSKRPRADTNTSDTECKLCTQTHTLERCWYAFPERASEDFIPNRTVQGMAQRLLKSDPELVKEIERIRKKRAKQDEFLNFRRANPYDAVYAGDGVIPIEGFGEVDIRVQGPKGPEVHRLYDVAFCPNMATNLVSLRILNRSGYWWDNKPSTNLLRRRDGSILCRLQDRLDQFVMEYLPLSFKRTAFYTRRNKLNSYTGKPLSRGDLFQWHLRMGHPGPEALRHLVALSRGVGMRQAPDGSDEIKTAQCDACGVSKIKRQINRLPREKPTTAGTRLAIDFHDFEDPRKNGGAEWCVMLITDRFSGFTFDYYLHDRTYPSIKIALGHLIKYLRDYYKTKVLTIECDNEITIDTDSTSELAQHFRTTEGITFEVSPPNTQALNGGAERLGGVIKDKARSMRNGSKLPTYLWVEIVKAAVYLYNRTPKYLYNWRTPYEKFYNYFQMRDGIVGRNKIPILSHLKVYGCKAFAMTSSAQQKTNRRRKLDPKAWIGYLIGYQSSTTYRIWLPKTNKIVVTRDVIFDENATFSGDIRSLKDDLLKTTNEEFEALVAKITQQIQPETTQQFSTNSYEDQEVYAPIDPAEEAEAEDDLSEDEDSELDSPVRTDHPYTEAIFAPYPTPPESPDPCALLSATIREAGQGRNLNETTGSPDPTPRFEGSYHTTFSGVTARESCWEATFNAGRLATAELRHGMLVSKADKARSLKRPSSHPGSN